MRNALATVFKSGSLFIVLQLVLVAVSVVWLANVGRISAHTQINSWNSSALDSLMPYITDIGDGITITIACLLLF
ncbi:MAG: hypothetical protein LW750_04300, partial [Bacteroidetes bacterium]|nr:hypothetical protein [Bacteroidota bacterium]